MNRKLSRALGIMLALALVLTAMPVTVSFAADDETVNYGYHDIGYSTPAIDEPANNKGESTIPSSYDGRTAGHEYTAVKNQGSYGSCWAHAMTAAVETSLIRQGLATTDINLSELQLATATYGKAHDELGLLGNDSSVSTENESALDIGGNRNMSAMSLARWTGSASEDTMNYSEDAGYAIDENSVYSEDYYYGFDEAHLYRYLSVSSKNTDSVKSMIMEYGIAITSYYHSSTYYNSSTGAYYTNEYTSTNHEITVIGWDDDYSKDNFSSNAQPSKNGAWLVRNSWGTGSGNDGYIWISYYDTSLDDSFGFVDVVSSDTWDYNYQYDGGFSLNYNPVVGDVMHNSNGVANIYTATSHQYLKAVNISFLESTNVTLELKIFVNPSGDSFFSKDTPAYSGTYTTTYAGIYTFDLTTPVELHKGDNFAVYYKITDTDQISPYYEYSATTSWDWISFTEDNSNARSYGCGSSSIKKLSDGVYRIKAYTVDADLARPANFSVKMYSGNNAVLKWDAVEGATEYEVYSGTDLSGYTLKAVTDSTTLIFPEYGTGGIVVKYKVRAKNDTVTGNFCNSEALRFTRKYSVTNLALADTTVIKGSTVLAQATLTPFNANDIMVGYTVADTSVATVTPDGRITGVSAGTTTITGVTRNGVKTATATVTVTTGAHTCTAGNNVKENCSQSTCVNVGGWDVVTYCTICGRELSRTRVETDLDNHTASEATKENETASTCLTNGGYYTVTRCTVCGCVLTSEYTALPLSGHTPAQAVQENVVPATCLTAGSYDSVVYCTVCGTEISRESKTAEALGHTPYVSRAAKAATCGADGNTQEISCKTCKEVLTAAETIPATGEHTAADAVTENRVYSTCTEDGGYDTVVYCKVCRKELSREHITDPAHGHMLYESKAAVPATCVSTGMTAEISCHNCSNVIEEATVIPATGVHTAGTAVKENTVNATCTTAGSYDSVVYCTVCGTRMSGNTVSIAAKGHSMTKTAAKAATCTAAGNNEYYTCKNCGGVFKDADGTTPTTAAAEKINALGHDNVSYDAIPATCQATGCEAYTVCKRCGYSTYKETAKIAHNYVNGVCTMCGAAEPDASETCTHICHQSGFMGFIWKIVNLFNKLFKINQYCSCGKAHW